MFFNFITVGKKIGALIFAAILISSYANAQKVEDGGNWRKGDVVNFGIETQWYPAGLIPGVAADVVLKKRLALNLRLGLNFANRHDWGVNQNEYGYGYGGTFGFRYFKDNSCKGLFAGLRLDIWKERIYWKNKAFSPDNGVSKILVLQPTAEIGYFWRNIKNGKFGLGLTTAMGFEINTITKGKPVGQGLINLVGLTITYDLRPLGYTIGTPSF